MRGLSLVAASGGHSSSRCARLSLSRPLSLRSTGSRRAGSVIVAHGPICSVACGIFPDQGSNPCPLHWQADSQPLHHQGSPHWDFWERPLLHVDATWRASLFFRTVWGWTWLLGGSYLPPFWTQCQPKEEGRAEITRRKELESWCIWTQGILWYWAFQPLNQYICFIV